MRLIFSIVAHCWKKHMLPSLTWYLFFNDLSILNLFVQLQALTKCVKQLGKPKTSNPTPLVTQERIVASSTPLPSRESKSFL